MPVGRGAGLDAERDRVGRGKHRNARGGGGRRGVVAQSATAAADQQVIAVAAQQRVRSDIADERVGFRTAGEHIGIGVAGELVGRVRSTRQVLDAGELVALGVAADAATIDEADGDTADRIDISGGVGAEATDERVGARAAFKRVTARSGRDDVVERISAAEISGAAGVEGQILYKGVGCAAEIEGRKRGLDRVGAAIRGNFDHHITGRIDKIEIIAGATDQCVVALTALQRVAAIAAHDAVVPGAAIEAVEPRAAGDRVRARGADAGEGTRRGIGQVLDIGVSRVGQVDALKRRLDRVDIGGRRLDDDVGRGIDNIDIVARAARKRVIAGAAIERIGAAPTQKRVVAKAAKNRIRTGRVAGNRVVEIVAGAGEIARAGKDDVFDIGEIQRGKAEHVERGGDRVDAFIGVFDDGVGRRGDDIGVVAGAAGQRIGPDPAIEAVGTGASEQRIIAAEADQCVVTIIADKRVGTGIAHKAVIVLGADDRFDVAQRVNIFRGDAGDGRGRRAIEHDGHAARAGDIAVIGGIVAVTAVERVIARPADQGIVSGPAIQRVIARAARDLVVGAVARDLVGVCGADQVLDRDERVDIAARSNRDGRRAGRIQGRRDARAARDIGIIDRVDADPAIERIIAAAARKEVVAVPARDAVGVRIAEDRVRVRGTDDVSEARDRVAVGCADTGDRGARAVEYDREGRGILHIAVIQRIVAAPADKRVIAEAAGDHIVIGVADDRIAILRADDIGEIGDQVDIQSGRDARGDEGRAVERDGQAL